MGCKPICSPFNVLRLLFACGINVCKEGGWWVGSLSLRQRTWWCFDSATSIILPGNLTNWQCAFKYLSWSKCASFLLHLSQRGQFPRFSSILMVSLGHLGHSSPLVQSSLNQLVTLMFHNASLSLNYSVFSPAFQTTLAIKANLILQGLSFTVLATGFLPELVYNWI